jgi:hypothetical protein
MMTTTPSKRRVLLVGATGMLAVAETWQDVALPVERLDLEGAAGVGRLDVVKSFFNDDGSLKPPAGRREKAV